MLPVRFEPTALVGDRPQTHALDRAATGTGFFNNFWGFETFSCPTSIDIYAHQFFHTIVLKNIGSRIKTGTGKLYYEVLIFY